MPSFFEISKSIAGLEIPEDRLNYLNNLIRDQIVFLGEKLGTEVLFYGSDFLSGKSHTDINQNDVQALMSIFKGAPRDARLTLIIHSPGGYVHATEHVIKYIRNRFPRPSPRPLRR